MKIAVKVLSWLIGICLVLYAGICIFFYFYQEHLIFPARKLQAGYRSSYTMPYKEYSIRNADGDTLDGLLFKAQASKGLIFYLHGNAGSAWNWKKQALFYTGLGYDVFSLDYPGYGQSSGHISSLNQLFNSVQAAYDTLKKTYPENRIVILGYSIGTGPAAWLASQSHARELLLMAPYYSLADISFRDHPYLPHFILKYPINTYLYLQHTTAPVTIFHGDRDQTIYTGSSYKLKPYLKPGDKLFILKGQTHDDFEDNPEYAVDLKEVL